MGENNEDTEKSVTGTRTGRTVKRPRAARDGSCARWSCSRQIYSIGHDSNWKALKQSIAPTTITLGVYCSMTGRQGIQYLYNSVPNVQKSFELLTKIGEGTFSSVFLGRLKEGSGTFALKHLIPTSSVKRIEDEIKYLKSLSGKANIIELKACIRYQDHVVLVMPYFPHDKFQDYLHYMSLNEVGLYMYNLFQALQYIHSHGIIHRDIKPGNFLYHRDTGRFRLVDFGLAQLEPAARTLGPYMCSSLATPPSRTDVMYSRRGVLPRSWHPSHLKNEICEECQSRKSQVASRAGTPGFRAPEVLLKCPNQSTAIDIWSAGVILLSLLSGRYPFFKPRNDQEALAQVIGMMGSKECANISNSLGKELIVEPELPPSNLKDICLQLHSNIKTANRPAQSWDNIPDSVFDLLKLSLDINPITRLTAKTALFHSFFISMGLTQKDI